MKSFRSVLTAGLLFAAMALSLKDFGALADTDLMPYTSKCDPSLAPVGEIYDFAITGCDYLPCNVTRGYCYEVKFNVKCGDYESRFNAAAAAYFFGYLYPLAEQADEMGSSCDKGQTVPIKFLVCIPEITPIGYYDVQMLCKGYGPDGTEHCEGCLEGSMNVY